MAKTRVVGPLVTIIVVAAVAAGGWYFFRGDATPPPEVTSVTVSKGDIIQGVTATGTVEAVTVVDVSSQISGLISEVLVDYNSKVKEGDVLARIDPATYQSRLSQAEAQLANTNANYNLVRINAERVRALREKNLVSAQELDQAEAQLKQAEAQMQIQTAAVESAKVDLSRCTIVSPIDGVVIDKIAEVGKTVAASLNAPTLFTIVNDLRKMQIAASVAEADIGNIAVGQEAQFTVDAFPSRQFQGRVSQVRNSPSTEQSVVVYATIIDVDNSDLKLKPGMTANVTIVVAKRRGVLKIPNAAIRVRVPDDMKAAEPAPEKPVAVAGQDGKPAAPASAEANAAGQQQGEQRRGGGDPDRRAAMRQLFQDAGISFGNGPPSPDQLAKLRALAEERGIELPERFAGNRPTSPDAIVSRVLYKPAGTPQKPMADPVRVKLGITDGISTEVIEGLKEGDQVVTAITTPSANSTQTRNPFGGGRRF